MEFLLVIWVAMLQKRAKNCEIFHVVISFLLSFFLSLLLNFENCFGCLLSEITENE